MRASTIRAPMIWFLENFMEKTFDRISGCFRITMTELLSFKWVEFCQS
jgi:hypothetical protein